MIHRLLCDSKSKLAPHGSKQSSKDEQETTAASSIYRPAQAPQRSSVRKSLHKSMHPRRIINLITGRNRHHATNQSEFYPTVTSPTMSETSKLPSSLAGGRPRPGPCVVSIDVPDPDNFLMVLRVIQDHPDPDQPVHIVLSPRPVSFAAIYYGKTLPELLGRYKVSVSLQDNLF